MVHLIRGGEVGFATYVHRLVDVVGHADRSASFKDYCLEKLCTTPTLQTMLRIHFMQQWFGLFNPAMEDALHDVPMYQTAPSSTKKAINGITA